MDITVINGIAVMEIIPRVDNEHVSEVETILKTAIAGGATKVLCDFSGTNYIVSSGIRLLFLYGKMLVKSGENSPLFALPSVQKVFELAGTHPAVSVYYSQDEAIRALR
jgi:anti-anti-sigma regulatory factor